MLALSNEAAYVRAYVQVRMPLPIAAFTAVRQAALTAFRNAQSAEQFHASVRVHTFVVPSY